MTDRRATVVVLLLLVVAFVLLAARCFYLQHYKKDYCLQILLKRQLRVSELPRRGVILDRCGRVLGASNKIQIVFAEPRLVEDVKETANRIASILNMPAHEICRTILESKNPGFVKIKSDISAGQRQAIGSSRIRGIGIQSDWRRYYPMGNLACHVVGFTSRDNRGLGGIELEFEQKLRGSAGENIFFADARRRPIGLKAYENPCSDGTNVILTIDAVIQQFTRKELLEQFKSYDAESATAIVMEPQTGAVLALVCLPDFDPTDSNTADADNLRNRALTDTFEPGSILKPIVAAIALDTKAVSPDETIFCENGSYSGRGFGRIGEYGDHRFGELTVREIIARSSNIGMAKIGQKTGREKLFTGLRLFGFGRKTGIDLPGQAVGLLRPADEWTNYSVTRIPFGQEISVTAIQLARAFCVLANGGRAVEPYVVKATADNKDKVLNYRRPLSDSGFIVRPEVARWMVTEAMTAVVAEGTGRRASLEDWEVFGKTGTANIARSDGKGYEQDCYVASFAGGAPADSPQVVVLVSIYKPNVTLGKGYTGGVVAAPAAKKIIAKTLRYLKVPTGKIAYD
jgi:cell division protein FtsI/penicillin-binding protein 2